MNNPPNLYKYIKIDSSYPIKENFLTLKFSSPSTLNDPFEFLIGKIEDIKQNDINEIYRIVEKHGIPTTKIPNDPVEKINKFFKEKLHEIKETQYNLFNKLVKISSFSEDFDNILMWSHYTNKHEGFVIEYNINHIMERLNTENKRFFCSKISYLTDMPCIRNIGFLNTQDIMKELTKIISTKSDCWKYEKEWRLWLTYLKADNVENYKTIDFIKIMPEEVTKIFFGVKCSQKNIDRISSIVKDLNIHCSLFKSSIDESHYRLNFQQV